MSSTKNTAPTLNESGFKGSRRKQTSTTRKTKPKASRTTTSRTTTTTEEPLPITLSDDAIELLEQNKEYPKNVLGMYILLADQDVENYDDNSDWDPRLYEYQQKGANVLYFTFIHPDSMQVPRAFRKLAATRGSSKPGSVPSNTRIIFAIGGYSYSIKPNPWDWLTSKDKAENMAERVATWPEKYGCDGIDLDLEAGAGNKKAAGRNMVHFIRKLRQLQPDILIGQPTYGYPQVAAENYVINHANNLINSVGLMVYEGTSSLNYVKNYAKATDQWEGFPITSNTPSHNILLGCKGSARSKDIAALAEGALDRDLLGIMVWYASVRNGFQYEKTWDASISKSSQKAFVAAKNKLTPLPKY